MLQVTIFWGLFVLAMPVTAQQVTDTAAQRAQKEDLYKGMRRMALEVTADQLDVQVPAGEVKVYGVVTDWNMGKGIATIVSFATGDASMYVSTGGGILGGVQHASVNKAAKACVNKAQGFLDKASKTDLTPLPAADSVSFFLLTNKGIFTARESVKNFYNGTSPWLSLFEQVNELISALRLVQGSKKP
jgi:hypothetical protein